MARVGLMLSMDDAQTNVGRDVAVAAGDAAPPAGGLGPQQAAADNDLVAVDRQERAARRRQGPRRRWLPGHIFDRHSPVGIGILLAFVGVGMLYNLWRQDDGDTGVGARSSGVADAAGSVERPLTPAEQLQSVRYGRPLHRGQRGVPLVETPAGEIRELTPLEMSFPVGVAAIADPERPGVMMAPGLAGEGLWWRSPGPAGELGPAQAVDRITWFREQRRLLRQGLTDLAGALMHVGYYEPLDWSPEWGGHLENGTAAMRDYYAYGQYTLWPKAATRWRCHDGLETDLTQGVTVGCPSARHVAALGQVWAHIGTLNEQMWALGRAARLSPELERAEVSVGEMQSDLLQEIYWEMGLLRQAQSRLEAVGAAEGNVIQVDMPDRW